MTLNLATGITAFIIAFLIFPVIIKFSFKNRFLDIPGRRKVHTKETPSLGGVGIFAGFILAILIWIEFQNWGAIRYIMASMMIIFFLGLRDDLVPLKPMFKLMGQIIAAFVIVYMADIRLHSFYGLFGLYEEFSLWFSYGLSIFTIVVITNSFNLIDGLDGLAGTIASIALISFGIWFLLTEHYIFSLLCFALLGGVIAFLIFNWQPSDIFMGDTGALLIGLFLAIMAIFFIDTNYNLSESDPYKFTASVTTGACIIIIPLIDTLRIIILRLLKRQSPFTPDKSHVHHALVRLGLKHSQTTLILGLAHLSYILIVIVFRNVPDKFLLPAILIYSISLSVFLDRLIINKLSSKA